uniref:Uncharacterized protein n=1 Tax=Picea sitchensis TaxID=3332 RepID=D5AAR9_PICSI|nr:unknown [Picea sitchensis]
MAFERVPCQGMNFLSMVMLWLVKDLQSAMKLSDSLRDQRDWYLMRLTNLSISPPESHSRITGFLKRDLLDFSLTRCCCLIRFIFPCHRFILRTILHLREMFEPESRKAAGQFKRFRVRAVVSPEISGNGALLFDAQEAH